jgi:hypothetical protein
LLLMQDRGDDGGFAAAIPDLAYLRSYEFLERSLMAMIDVTISV